MKRKLSECERKEKKTIVKLEQPKTQKPKQNVQTTQNGKKILLKRDYDNNWLLERAKLYI